uniref:Uncharacterized protein n=1 Tax=viral metagenome TaxID=1070528 RepID=A0A6M3IN51_9ZZZZ
MKFAKSYPTGSGYSSVKLPYLVGDRQTMGVDDDWHFAFVSGRSHNRNKCSIRGDTVVITDTIYSYQDTQEAIELRELLDKWRARGKDQWADYVEYGEEGQVWDFLQDVTVREEMVEALVSDTVFF